MIQLDQCISIELMEKVYLQARRLKVFSSPNFQWQMCNTSIKSVAQLWIFE